jgi:hypothetical protein
LPSSALIDAEAFVFIAIPFVVGSRPSLPGSKCRWIGRGRQNRLSDC